MGGLDPFDMSPGRPSTTGIISRASLTMCEYSTWSSVSVGDAFRRNIRTLKKNMSKPARALQGITLTTDSTGKRSNNDQQSERSRGEKNQSPEGRVRWTQAQDQRL